MIESMSGLLISNLWALMPALWGCFSIYMVWYLTRAKHFAPLTSVEAKQLWSIHRQSTNCYSRKWRKIERKGKIVGFKCNCGYKHLQKRPLVANPPVALVNWQEPAFEGLQTPHKTT